MNKIERNPYFDFLRGFAIIMVVGIHTVTNYAPTFETFGQICTIIIRLFLNCAVPLFLAISGYFIASKQISWGNEHFKFLKKQVPKVYIPCLVFSLPYFILSLSYGDSIIKSIIYFFMCGFSVYYFIAVIIQYYLLLPAFTKFNNRGG